VENKEYVWQVQRPARATPVSPHVSGKEPSVFALRIQGKRAFYFCEIVGSQIGYDWHGRRSTEIMVRCFIAIELPESIRAALACWIEQLRTTSTRATWARAEHMHLTLRFLGNVPEDQISSIDAQLRASLITVSPFMLSIGGIGAFPSPAKPNVVWAGVQSPDGTLLNLQSLCENAARSAGLPPETRAFHPHITLARIKEAEPATQLACAIDAMRERMVDEFEATAVSLFESKLTAHGPVHTRLQEYPFK